MPGIDRPAWPRCCPRWVTAIWSCSTLAPTRNAMRAIWCNLR
jgi:hypothetical protein